MAAGITLHEVLTAPMSAHDTHAARATLAAAGLGSLVLPGLIYLAIWSAGASVAAAAALALWTAASLSAASGRAHHQLRRIDAVQRLRHRGLLPSPDSRDLERRLQLANRTLAEIRITSLCLAPTGWSMAGVNSIGHDIAGWPCSAVLECAFLIGVAVIGPAVLWVADRSIRRLDDPSWLHS